MSGRRLILAHGFTQTARSWREIERRLARRAPDWDTIAVDLPGHGEAQAGLADSDLRAAAGYLVDSGGRGCYVGYSMGGRVCLHAALLHPADVRGLVLIGATAGIDDDAERSARRVADERLADRIESIGVEAFVREWLGNPLFAGLTPDTAMVDDRLRNTAEGLAASLRSTGTGTQAPLWARLGEISVPVLVLAGEEDAKFRRLGERLAAGLPDAELSVVAGAGHSVHLERPDATVEAMTDWLNRRAPVRSSP